MNSRTWLSTVAVILVLLLSLTPAAAIKPRDIAVQCSELFKDFKEISKVTDTTEFLGNLDQFREEFAAFFEDFVNAAGEEGAVATPYAATETVLGVTVGHVFVDALGILHVQGLHVDITMTGDLVGSLTLTGGQAAIDLDTGGGVLITRVHYDVTFQGLSGTFDGCNVVPQESGLIYQVAVGDGGFEGMVLAATAPPTVGVLEETGTIFVLT